MSVPVARSLEFQLNVLNFSVFFKESFLLVAEMEISKNSFVQHILQHQKTWYLFIFY